MQEMFATSAVWFGLAVLSAILASHLRISMALMEICVGVAAAALAGRFWGAGDLAADDAYDLPGVPWVSYFNGGIAIHGTYWHNDYGRPWSHGCINVLPQDAKWFYRWALPLPSADQPLVDRRGTSVTVV